MSSPHATEPPPAWSLPRGVIVLLGTAAAVVVVAGLRGFADVVGPVFLALMLTVGVQPLLSLLERRGAPRWLAVLAGLVAVYTILLVLTGTIVVSVARLATLLPTYADDADALLEEVESWLTALGVGDDQLQSLLESFDPGSVFGVVQDLLTGLAGVLSNLLLIVLLLFFMGTDAAGFPDRLRAVAGQRPDLVRALHSFAHGTRRYLVVSTIFGLIVAVFDVGALYLIGVPLPLLWGLLAFITNYIPNIGFVVGLVPPALLALLDGGIRSMVLVVVAYSVINVLIQTVIQPRYVGDSVGLSTTLTFLSLVFWGWVIGPLGALLAIPLTLLAKALLVDVDPSTRWLSALIAPGGKREP